MKYPLVLFDADDTLFDFQRSQASAFTDTLAAFGLGHRCSEFFPAYQKHSQSLWRQLERGEITKEVLKTRRFELTFGPHGLELDCHAVSDTYLELLPRTPHLIDGAIELCTRLRQVARIGIITNGVGPVQKKRLERSPLKEHVEFMVVSDECGFAKPDRRIFEHTLRVAGHEGCEGVLMVGDRLEADIRGAQNLRLANCWFNPAGEKNHTGIRPDFEVRSLREILAVCGLED